MLRSEAAIRWPTPGVVAERPTAKSL